MRADFFFQRWLRFARCMSPFLESIANNNFLIKSSSVFLAVFDFSPQD